MNEQTLGAIQWLARALTDYKNTMAPSVAEAFHARAQAAIQQVEAGFAEMSAGLVAVPDANAVPVQVPRSHKKGAGRNGAHVPIPLQLPMPTSVE